MRRVSLSKDSVAETWQEPGHLATSWHYRVVRTACLQTSVPRYCRHHSVSFMEGRERVGQSSALIKGWSIESICKGIRFWNEQRFRTEQVTYFTRYAIQGRERPRERLHPTVSTSLLSLEFLEPLDVSLHVLSGGSKNSWQFFKYPFWFLKSPSAQDVRESNLQFNWFS